MEYKKLKDSKIFTDVWIYNPYSIFDLTEGSSKKIFFKCSKCKDVKLYVVRNRAVLKTGCNKCSIVERALKAKKRHIKENPFIINDYFKLKDKWSSLNSKKSNEYSIGSKELVLWECDKKHIWSRAIKTAIRSPECPFCTRQKALSGFNGLDITHPDIAKMWNYKMNDLTPDEVLSGSGRKFHWICKNGHQSYSAVRIKVRDNGSCKECSYKESSLESIVVSYLNENFNIKLLRNTKPLINSDGKRLELDIFIPELNIAFEVQDFWTHCRDSDDVNFLMLGRSAVKKGPSYHKLKKDLALEQLNVKLFDIWEDQIRDESFKVILNNIINNLIH